MSFSGLKIIDQWYAPFSTYPTHRDRFSRISVVLSGQLKEKAGKREEFATATSWVLKSKNVAHSDQFGPTGARIISFIFEEDFLKKIISEQPSIEWKWFHGLPYTHPSIQLLLKLHVLKHEDDLVDQLIEFFSWIEHPKAEIPVQKPGWLTSIQEKIDDEYQSALRVKDLAKMADIHPVYLARVFRKFYQCSIKDYIKRRRIRRVLDKLASSETALVQIALEEGFADQSHFSRTFKEQLGCTPANFRRLAQGELYASHRSNHG